MRNSNLSALWNGCVNKWCVAAAGPQRTSLRAKATVWEKQSWKRPQALEAGRTTAALELSSCTPSYRRHLAIRQCVSSHAVVSDSLWPHGLQLTRLLCPLGFSSQEYWRRLLPPAGDLPNPGTEPASLCLLHWQAHSLLPAPPGK